MARRWFHVSARILLTVLPLVALTTARTAKAALDYLVILKDGSAYQGDLVEYAPGDHVTIHLSTGETRRFAWSDISTPTIPPTPLPTPSSTTDSSPPPPESSSVPDLTFPDAFILRWKSSSEDRVTIPQEAPTNSGPQPGQLAMDLRMPMSVTLSDPSVSMEMLGLDLGLGVRITDGVYVGGLAGFAQTWDLSGGDPLVYLTTHEGGELQIITHRGSRLNDDGTPAPTGSYQWIGFRGGAEGVRSVAPTGGFAELDYGFGNIGVVLGAGVSFEPAGMFGSAGTDFADSTSSPPPTRTMSPFLSVALRFGTGG